MYINHKIFIQWRQYKNTMWEFNNDYKNYHEKQEKVYKWDLNLELIDRYRYNMLRSVKASWASYSLMSSKVVHLYYIYYTKYSNINI
jgi:hypothetical protein